MTSKKLHEMLVCNNKEDTLFGLEIEMEVKFGPNYDGMFDIYGDRPANWAATGDRSLQGHSVEYLFNKPFPYDQAVKNIHSLYNKLDEKGVEVVPSIRTAVHIHYNQLYRTSKEILTSFCALTTVEELFLQTNSPESRQRNPFCFSSSVSEGNLHTILNNLHTNYKDKWFFVREEMTKYSSINIATLRKHGTLEFRCFDTPDNAKDVIYNLTLVRDMMSRVENNFSNPVDVVEMYSHIGDSREYLKLVFPDYFIEKIYQKFNEKEVSDFIVEGIRLIQGVAYNA